jgi:CRISPR-associated protein Cas8b/Csh1 subtype I-B
MSAPDGEAFKQALPEFSIGSLRQVLSVYGRLGYLSRGITSFDGYLPYYTPNKVDESMAVVVVDLDLTGESIDVEEGRVRSLKPDDAIERLGYSWYYASRGHDYSFTHRTSSSKSSTVANWLSYGLTKWAPPTETPEYPPEAIEDHPDIGIIKSLRAVSDDTIEELKTMVEAVAPEDGENKLLTARFRVSTDQVERYAETVTREGSSLLAYPGELDICNAVTKASRLAGYTTMDSVDGRSRGRGADMNTGDQADLVGFATDHLKHYTSKQRERFPRFNPFGAWQVHPVSEEEALYLDEAGDYIDACYSSFGQFRVYHFPYYRGTMSAAEGQALYDFLEHLVDVRESESERRASALTHFRDFAAARDEPRLKQVRFWTVFQNYEQKDRRDVFREEGSIRIKPAERLAQAHLEVFNSGNFGEGGLPKTDTETALTRPGVNQEAIAATIDSGWYLTRTFPDYVSGTETDQSPATDDPRPRVIGELLAGGTVDTEFLLSEYLTRLSDEFDGDGGNLRYRLAEQAAQLKALAGADMLTASNETQKHLTEPPLMTNDDTTDTDAASSPTETILGDTAEESGTTAENPPQTVSKAARSYIERTPALSENDDRAAAFLLGYTTGMMSRYQAGAEGMTRTFAARFPAHDLTVTGAKRLYTELQGKAVAYADGAGALYQDLLGELTEVTTRTPDEWELSLVDMRFHYGEGVALSLNAASRTEQDSDDDSAN